MPSLVYANNELVCYSIVVPLVPPSANRVVRHTNRGRHYAPADVVAFDKAMILFSRGKVFTEDPALPLLVSIQVCLPPGKRGDPDNFVKPVLDALVKAEIIKTDAHVIHRMEPVIRGKEAYTAVTIEKWRGDGTRQHHQEKPAEG